MRFRTLIPASALTCLVLAAASILPAVPGQSKPVARVQAPPAAVRLVAYRPLHAVEALPERRSVDPLAHAAPEAPCTCPGCVDTGC